MKQLDPRKPQSPFARSTNGTSLGFVKYSHSIEWYSRYIFVNTLDMSSTMRAAVIHDAGGPEVLKLETKLVPQPKDGEVLIKVHAFGLNRSELFTRQGLSPSGMSTVKP